MLRLITNGIDYRLGQYPVFMVQPPIHFSVFVSNKPEWNYRGRQNLMKACWRRLNPSLSLTTSGILGGRRDCKALAHTIMPSSSLVSLRLRLVTGGFGNIKRTDVPAESK